MAERKALRKAVALSYDKQNDGAPRVVATGSGLMADRIVEAAEAAGVPVKANADLAEALGQVELGAAIPEVLYPVVAEVLVFVARMNRQRGKKQKS